MNAILTENRNFFGLEQATKIQIVVFGSKNIMPTVQKASHFRLCQDISGVSNMTHCLWRANENNFVVFFLASNELEKH